MLRRRVAAFGHLAQFGIVMFSIAAFSQAVHAITIELNDAGNDRIERQRAAVIGRLPLPGTPDTTRLDERLAQHGVAAGTELFLRVFKSESLAEIWMRKDDGYFLFASYPICNWSGTLGPKRTEGDRQSPEGFYTITRRQLHRKGRWPRSLNLGFPNAFDKAESRTGSYILMHGGCSSVGCFAMTNSVMSEIYKLAEAALNAGQRHIHVHIFPFRLSESNLALHASSPWQSFWENLKEGYDSFERTRRPPQIKICEHRYVVDDAATDEMTASGRTPVCGESIAVAGALERLESVLSRFPFFEQGCCVGARAS